MTAKEYFWSNVKQAVELEDEDGYRFWSEPMTPTECDEYIKSKCKTKSDMSKPYYLSDRDFMTEQYQDTFCARVMKLADLNFFKNQEWCEKNNLTSFYEVIDFILDNELYNLK